MPMTRTLRPTISVIATLLVLVIILASSVLPVAAQDERPLADLDIILIIDESGSMWLSNDKPTPLPPNPDGSAAVGWENPGWRISLAKMFANLLGVEQSGARHRLSVVVFGSEAKLTQPLTEIQDTEARQKLLEAIDLNHKNMVWTNIPEAIRVAQEEVEARGRADATTKRAIVLLTDGKHETHRDMTTPENEAAFALIRESAQRARDRYPIYTVAFKDEAARADPGMVVYKNLWQEIAATTGGLYFEPTQPDRELLDVYMQILYDLWDLPSETVPEPVISPIDVPVEINEDLYEVIISVVKYNRDVQVMLIRPDGTIVKPADPGIQFASADLTDSYSVGRPAKGTWTVRMTGNGQVIVVPVRVPPRQYKVERTLPTSSVHPLGKPMDIAVTVLDLDQKPLAPQSLNLDVVLPDGSSRSVPLTPSGTRFAGRLEPVDQEGEYLLNFSGEHQGVKVADQHTIRVIAAPWLQIAEPVAGVGYPYNLPLPARAQLMFQTDPITQLNPGDKLEVIARLLDVSNQSLDTRQLQPAAGGVYGGEMGLPGEGAFVVRFELKGQTSTGERFEDVSEVLVSAAPRAADTPTPVTPTNTPPPTETPVPPTATPVPPTATSTFTPLPTNTPAPTYTPSPTPLPPPPPEPMKPGAIAGIAGSLLGLAAVGGLLVKKAVQPVMVGMLDVGGMPVSLSGKSVMTIGSDPRAGVPLIGEGILPKHAELRAVGSKRDPRVLIRSLDPTNNPVYVNGAPTPSATLNNNDIVQIGNQQFTYGGAPEPFDTTPGIGDDFDVTPGGGTTGGSGDSWTF